MKKVLFLAILATAISTFANVTVAEDKPPKLLIKAAGDIRAGTINVGKEYSLTEEGRYHKIHSEILGMKCKGCHTHDAYPDGYLNLRKDEFPKTVDGEKTKAVEPAKCIGCHSEGNVATVFYNKQ